MTTAEKAALPQSEIDERLRDLPLWKQVGQEIVRVQVFPSYKDALNFVYQVGLAAEAEDHHPDIVMSYKKVEIHYATHSAGGLTVLDFRMAGTVERLVQQFFQPK